VNTKFAAVGIAMVTVGVATLACSKRDSSDESASALASAENFKEIPQPNEAASIQTAIRLVQEKIAAGHKAEGVAKRDAHPKPHGCLRGTVSILESRDPRTKFGLFKDVKSYPLWARASDAALLPNSSDDRIPDARGFALKILGVAGAKEFGPASGTNVDMHFVNAPMFIADNIAEYNEQLSNAASVLANRGGLLAKILRITGLKDPLYGNYSSVSPQKLGPNAVKYRLVPCAGEREESILFGGSNYLRDSMRNHLADRPACMNIQAQFFVNEAVTPIEKTTVEWQESDAPFVTVAQVTIPKQAFEAPEREAFCEKLAFNPWRVLAGQRPLGSLNRARKAVYEASAKFRSGLNRTETIEPTGNEPF
jgi:hypothetical protein